MTDITMKAGNFEAIPEKGDDNFATSIYESEYDGILIARCNQNGRYPEQARAILEGLNGKKRSQDEFTQHAREDSALLVEAMIKQKPYADKPWARMALAIAARAIRRGRLLTEQEKLANLMAFYSEGSADGDTP